MSKKHKKVFVAWTFTEPMVFVCDAAVIRFLLTDERILKVTSVACAKFDICRATVILLL